MPIEKTNIMTCGRLDESQTSQSSLTGIPTCHGVCPFNGYELKQFQLKLFILHLYNTQHNPLYTVWCGNMEFVWKNVVRYENIIHHHTNKSLLFLGIVSKISLEIAFWLVNYRHGWILIWYSGITFIIFSRQSVFRGQFSD